MAVLLPSWKGGREGWEGRSGGMALIRVRFDDTLGFGQQEESSQKAGQS